MGQIADIQKQVHELAVSKGWWHIDRLSEKHPIRHETKAMDIGSKLCLIHSEISEALEFVRDGGPYDATLIDGKPEGVVVELADTVIRIMDLCGALGLDLEAAILQKLEYNRGRKHRHGGRLL